MGKNVLIKTSMGKSLNEMGNCPFTSHLVASLMLNIVLVHYLRYECVISIHATLFDFHQSTPWIFANVPPVLSPIGEYPLNFRQYTLCTFANWRISTELSPIYPLYFRQLADIHWTFASIPSGFSPIISESLIGEVPESLLKTNSSKNTS